MHRAILSLASHVKVSQKVRKSIVFSQGACRKVSLPCVLWCGKRWSKRNQWELVDRKTKFELPL